MTRFMIGVVAVLILGFGAVILFVLAIGRLLPEEDEIVFSSHYGYGINRMALARGITAPMMHTQTSVIQPDWSPDGKHIAYVDNGSSQLILYIADSNGQNQRLMTDFPHTSDYDPQWSPDGRFIAYSTSNSQLGNRPVIELMLFDTETQTRLRLTTTNIFREHMLYWSPDGTQIAFVLYSQKKLNSDILSINISTGAIRTLVSTSGNDEYPVWSPDGRYLVFVGGNSQRGIYLLDTVTGQPSLLYDISGVIYPSDWSQDGRFIFFSSAHNIYKLEVSACLRNPKTCTPELLIIGGGDARRKPRNP